MNEELSFLRRKVNRLEDMIFNINDKIGLILEKFLNHRASHVADIRQVMQVEEDLCVSLITQLQSCVISSRARSEAGNANSISITPSSKNKSVETAGRLRTPPSRNLVSTCTNPILATATRRGTRSTSAIKDHRKAAAKMPKPKLTYEAEEYEHNDDPLDEGDSNSNFDHFVNVKSEVPDVEFQTDNDHNDEFDVLDEHELASNPGEDSDPEYQPASDEDDSDHVKEKSTGSAASGSQTKWRNLAAFRTFACMDEAKSLIKAEMEFCYETRGYTPNGTKFYYYCRKDRKCPVKMYLMLNESTGSVVEFKSVDPPPHVHRPKPPPKRALGGLAPEVKSAVDEIYLGAPSGSVLMDKLHAQLIQRGFVANDIPKHKLRNYIQGLRRRRFGDLSFMQRRKRKKPSNASSSKPKESRKDLSLESENIGISLTHHSVVSAEGVEDSDNIKVQEVGDR